MRFIIIFISYWLLITRVTAAPPAEVPALPVEAVVVKQALVTEEILAVGSLLAEESVVIRAEIPGRITALPFSEGQKVAQDDVLVVLDAAEYQARLAESEATVHLNELSFRRTQDLLQKDLTSQQLFDEARAQLAVARARWQLDQVQLEKTKLHAPFAGILGLRHLSPGAYIETGQDIVTLLNISTVKLDFRVPEKFLSQISSGQTITVQVDAYPQQTFTGRVYALAPAMDEETRSLLLRARLPNPDRQLYPGMFARVTLVLTQRPHALLIPEEALVPQEKGQFVYKIEENKAVLTQVTLGQRRAKEVEVKQGLKEGDKIVTRGQLKLQAGMAVNPIF